MGEAAAGGTLIVTREGRDEGSEGVRKRKVKEENTTGSTLIVIREGAWPRGSRGEEDSHKTLTPHRLYVDIRCFVPST